MEKTVAVIRGDILSPGVRPVGCREMGCLIPENLRKP